jgi:hypothetical protein
VSDQSQGAGWWQASDGKWYPPSQAAETSPPPPPVPGSAYGPPAAPIAQPGMAYPAGYAVAQPAKQGMSGCAKAAIVVVVLGLLLGGGCVVAALVFSDEVADSIDDVRQNGREDVDIISCELDDAGFMVAEIEITNGSSGTSQYAVIVEFGDAGSSTTQTGPAGATGVEPGETRVVEARSTSVSTEELDCRILEAFRTADEGDSGN